MSCGDANMPVALEERTKTAAFSAVELDSPTQWWPVAAEVLEFTDMAQAESQDCAITQVSIRLTAASAATYAQDVDILIWSTSAPTTPTEGAVYNGEAAGRAALARVAAADWKRLSATVIEAVVVPEGPADGKRYVTGTGASATTLYATAVFVQASPVTLPNPTTIEIGLTSRLFKV